MAARIKNWHDDRTRQKIQTSQLINRLQKHIFSDKNLMTTSQVMAADKLLRKVLPDLASVELSGELENKYAGVTDAQLEAQLRELLGSKEKQPSLSH